jgi:hypothetical protein
MSDTPAAGISTWSIRAGPRRNKADSPFSSNTTNELPDEAALKAAIRCREVVTELVPERAACIDERSRKATSVEETPAELSAKPRSGRVLKDTAEIPEAVVFKAASIRAFTPSRDEPVA